MCNFTEKKSFYYPLKECKCLMDIQQALKIDEMLQAVKLAIAV